MGPWKGQVKGSLGITLYLERGSWGRHEHWAMPPRSCKPCSSPASRQKSPETETTTYQMGESYVSEATSWSNTPLWTADGRQDTVGPSATLEEAVATSYRALTSDGLISYQGNQLGARASMWTATDKGL